jgi:hypothetical protein
VKRQHHELHALFLDRLYKLSRIYGAKRFPRVLFTTSKNTLREEMLERLEEKGLLNKTLEKQTQKFVAGLRRAHSFSRDVEHVVWVNPKSDDYAITAEASHVAFEHAASERAIEVGSGLSETADFLAQYLFALEQKDKKQLKKLNSLARAATRCFEHAETPFHPALKAVGIQAAVNQLYGTCVAFEAIREGFNNSSKIKKLLHALSTRDFYHRIGRPPKMLNAFMKAAMHQKEWRNAQGRARLEHVLEDRLAETRAIRFIHSLARKY